MGALSRALPTQSFSPDIQFGLRDSQLTSLFGRLGSGSFSLDTSLGQNTRFDLGSTSRFLLLFPGLAFRGLTSLAFRLGPGRLQGSASLRQGNPELLCLCNCRRGIRTYSLDRSFDRNLPPLVR